MQKILLLSAFLLCSCAKDASKLSAGKSFIQRTEILGINAVEGRAMEVVDGDQVRSITMLVYPSKEDLEGFAFQSAENKKESWDDFLDSISYRDMIKRNYVGLSAEEMAVQSIFTVISVGESRDQAFLKKSLLEKEIASLYDEKSKLELPPVEISLALEEVEIEMEPFRVCYYKKSEKPETDEENYKCMLEKSGDYKKKKTARSSCEQTFRFDFIDLGEEEAFAFENMKEKCSLATANYQTFLDTSEGEVLEIDTKIEELEPKVAPLINLRESGKSVVLDILQKAEKHVSTSRKLKVPFVGTGSTKEQEDGEISRVRFGSLGEEYIIEELKLHLSFGTFYQGGSETQEFSLANGKIIDLKYYKKNNKVIKLEFTILADGFKLFANLSETIQDGFGIRYVGELIGEYENGETRKGVLKIELDQKEPAVVTP